MKHEPVLLQEVQKYCSFKTRFKENDCIIDCTLGLGGHAKHIIKKVMKGKGIYIAFEQDERNLVKAKKNLKDFKNIIYIKANFESLAEEIKKLKRNNKELRIYCMFFDLGLSSPHLDNAERGFSFQKEGPLDMRFDQSYDFTAEDVLNQYKEEELVTIFKDYGEERFSRRIAAVIKKNLPLKTTTELAEIVKSSTGYKKEKERIKAVARIFQSLRIEVNRELKVLKTTLPETVRLIEPGGRIIIISYHSLEDRIVKHYFKRLTRDCICPPEIPICQCDHKKQIKILTKKPITPTEKEIEQNPRSRSAKMRVFEKI